MPTAEQDAYDHGVEVGKLQARLDGHDAHADRVNGSIERMTESIGGLTATVSKLRSDVATRDGVELSVKRALADKSRAAWTTRERAIAALLALVTVSTFVANLLHGW